MQAFHSIAGQHRAREYERGQVLFQQGDAVAFCYVILEGRLKIYRQRADGAQAVVSILEAGAVYFDASLFGGGDYTVSGETVCRARIVSIGADAVRREVEQRPQLAIEILKSARPFIDDLVDQVETLKVLSASQRLADYLVRGADATAGAAVVDLPFEKGLLAGHLGMTPESFSRALGKLRRLGVAVARNTVRIEALERLTTFVGSHSLS